MNPVDSCSVIRIYKIVQKENTLKYKYTYKFIFFTVQCGGSFSFDLRDDVGSRSVRGLAGTSRRVHNVVKMLGLHAVVLRQSSGSILCMCGHRFIVFKSHNVVYGSRYIQLFFIYKSYFIITLYSYRSKDIHINH